MLNCYNCIYLDAENHYCKRKVHNVPGVCPYAEERPPRNNYERLKAMSVEEMADWFVMNGCGCDYRAWLNWLKEAIADG